MKSLQTLQFVGVSPEQFLKDLLRQLKTHLIDEFNQMQKEEVYLTAKQVGERFSVSTTTVQNWENERILKPYKLGGRKYYKLSEIEQELKN